MVRRAAVAAAVLIAGVSARGGDADWPRFRGPNGAGISDAVTVPVKWTPEDYNWKAKLPGAGHGSPVLWGSRVFLICCDNESARRTVLCLAAADGRILWQRDYPSKPYAQHQDNSFATSTPAADADGLYVTWTTPDEVVLLALDHEGRDKWRRNLGPFVGKHGSGTSPIVYEDIVVLANEQEDLGRMPGGGRGAGQSFLAAVDRKTGRTRWQTPRRTALAAYSTPCVYRPADGPPELIFTSTAHGITSVEPATGKVLWAVEKVFLDRCVASPVCAPGLVIASYGYGTRGTLQAAVRPPSRQASGEPQIAWETKKSVPLVPTPIVKDGRLFCWADDGTVTCMNVSSGEVIWRERVGGQFYGSPVCVNNRLYCIAKNGEVVVIAASEKYEPLGRVALGEPSFATPAVAGGVMYLRTAGHLFSLRKSGQESR
jgi:outer membrane protein assembly factor BamB